ncbi:MAG: glycosyltransferase family 1 protein [Prolixibacteraceae bacterium]|nr:glycosyltransferase family 1 protein [Prolixibacteraceae bacterium]
MKVAIVVNGTRGDVQPMLALAKGLIEDGHEVICCAPPENEELAKRYNIQFVAFGPNYKELFKQNAKMKGGAAISPSPKSMKRDTANQIDLLPELLKDSNLVLGVGFVLGVHTFADFLKVPYRFVIFYPVLLGPVKTDPFVGRKLFAFGRFMTNMVMKSFINKKRVKLGLQPIADVWSDWMGENVIVACDKELNTTREGVMYNFVQTGYMMLPSLTGLPENVENFLNAGKSPVFIGFGSNPVSRPEKYSQIFDQVSKATNQRLIVSKGWADLPEDNTPTILYVDEMPFELLFPRLAAIVYHGGTGTMAAAARAGIPQVAFPFMADQFENRKQIVKLGLGPSACDFRKLSADALISAIKECVANEKYKKSAIELSQKIQSTNGLQLTIQLLEKEVYQ